jgi:ketosteroid isomerase-like protein
MGDSYLICQPGGVSRPDYYGNPAGLTEDVDVVRAIYAAFAARDIEGALDFVAPDCEIHLERTPAAAGRTGPYRGHDGLREYFADVERVWHELEVRADDYRTVPGSVVVMGTVSGHTGSERLSRRAMWSWKLRDGRAVGVRVSDLGTA